VLQIIRVSEMIGGIMCIYGKCIVEKMKHNAKALMKKVG